MRRFGEAATAATVAVRADPLPPRDDRRQRRLGHDVTSYVLRNAFQPAHRHDWPDRWPVA